jgi:hypothetical protein
MAIKMTQDEFIKKCNKIHNNFYIYDDTIYKNADSSIDIICPEHGHFNQNAYLHSKGHGCKKCMGDKFRNDRKLIDVDIIQRFNKIHNNKYDYSLIDYRGLNSSKIIITCPIHGNFEQYPKNHLNGMGCQKCSKNNKFTKDHFISRAKSIHSDTYQYDIPDNFNNKSTIKITCDKHGDFYQSVNNHLNNKQGCPICRYSKGERTIFNYLKSNKIEFEKQKVFKDCNNIKGLKFDFYLPNENTCIEFDGIQHIHPIDRFGGETYFNYIKLCDDIKNRFCKDNNINIIRIAYKDLKNIEKILDKEL